jgi:hypothetical protein
MTNEVKNSKIGRPKGSPNARTQDLYAIAERLEVNPFEVLLHFAKRDYEALGMDEFKETTKKDGSVVLEPSISPETQMNAAGKACEYLYPKRRSIDHKFDDDKDPIKDLKDALRGK